MTFDLPMPPTSNSMFSTVIIKGKPRRITTRGYKAWREAAGDALARQYAAMGAPALHRPVSLSIRVGLNYTGDISNRIKAVEDLLVTGLEMPDDRYIERIVIERDQSIEGAVVTVEGSYAGEARPIGEIIKPIMSRLAAGVAHD